MKYVSNGCFIDIALAHSEVHVALGQELAAAHISWPVLAERSHLPVAPVY
jgi:hypothetical protein